MQKLTSSFFNHDTVEVAKALLGKRIQKGAVGGIIVETEAYKDDPASHAAKETKRSRLMRYTQGKVYVYFIYGNHYCLNFTTEKNKSGAVLIRAVEPTNEIELMKKRRNTDDVFNLTNGPGKLCQAFDITKNQNGEDIGKSIKLFDIGKKPEIKSSKRIGISKATDLDWRFYIADNKFISKP